MKTTKTFGLLSLGLLLMISLINVIDAQTLVAGKVYTSGYNDIVPDASISVVCNNGVPMTTTSLDDGTYAVRFNQSECGLGNNVEVSATKGDLSGSASGVVIECNDQNDCAEGYVSIINLAKPVSSVNNWLLYASMTALLSIFTSTSLKSICSAIQGASFIFLRLTFISSIELKAVYLVDSRVDICVIKVVI